MKAKIQKFTVDDFNAALASGPYAWPGGYPLFFVTDDGEALSFASASVEANQIRDSIATNTSDGWRVVAVEVNWEDEDLRCSHSSEIIESAYGN
jgi:hypothetical protein